MTDAQTILKMIETVDPNDTAKMDDVDARVWCYIHDCKFLDGPDKEAFYCIYKDGGKAFWKGIIKYTRSRDALKAIRPKGYISGIFLCGGKWCDQLRGWCQKMGEKSYTALQSPWNDTEDISLINDELLAELHAIIQAIEHDRSTAPLDTEQGD